MLSLKHRVYNIDSIIIITQQQKYNKITVIYNFKIQN